MSTTHFRGLIDENAAFLAYAGQPPAPARPISFVGANVANWQVDSSGQIFFYKIVHNLHLANPNDLTITLKYVWSFNSDVPVHARVTQRTADYFVVEGYANRVPVGPGSEYQTSCGFIFDAALHNHNAPKPPTPTIK